MADEGFGAMSSLMFAQSFGDGLNAGMMEAASEEDAAQHKKTLENLMARIADTKQDLRTFRPVTKKQINDVKLWLVGERELGVGLPVFIPHDNFGPCLAVKGTLKELWGHPGVKVMHFLVRRLHPLSVSKQNSDTAHFLVPIYCPRHGIDIQWLLPMPVGLVGVEVPDLGKNKNMTKDDTRLTMVVWKNNKPTELTSATLEEVYQVMGGSLGDDMKLGMRAMMEMQNKQSPALFAKYLQRSVSLVEKYGGASSARAMNGGDGPAILMQDRIAADPNELPGVLGDIMPLALAEPTKTTSNIRIASMFILNHAPWMRARFFKTCQFPNLEAVMHKKNLVVQSETRAIALSKSWTTLNKPETSAITRKAISQTFADSFSSFALDD